MKYYLIDEDYFIELINKIRLLSSIPTYHIKEVNYLIEDLIEQINNDNYTKNNFLHHYIEYQKKLTLEEINEINKTINNLKE